MTIITIPENLTKGQELVVITRKQYEKYLRFEVPRKIRAAKISRGKIGDPILASVRRAIRDYQAGKTSGPFTTVDELVGHLKLSVK